MRARAERGVALLEALVALAIVGAVGVATLGLLAAGLGGEAEARRRERELWAADRLLTAHTLLTRRELDQRIGRRDAGGFVIDVQRPERTLYRIAVSHAASPHVDELVTVVYRADDPNAP
jgi:hypothetical protein